MEKLESYYHHIDNGGISIDIFREDIGYPIIKFATSYYGYPAISAELPIGPVLGQKISSDILKEIGLMFIAASNKL
jgi:hypothetical protein